VRGSLTRVKGRMAQQCMDHLAKDHLPARHTHWVTYLLPPGGEQASRRRGSRRRPDVAGATSSQSRSSMLRHGVRRLQRYTLITRDVGAALAGEGKDFSTVGPQPRLHEVAKSNAVVTLGEDVQVRYVEDAA
jgi:hypothetical protein